MLRQAREAAGLHIGALAVALKVPVRKIEALENDRVDDLPDAVFARALAGSVCRHLKVDPKPVLAALPRSKQSFLPEVEPSLDTMRFAGHSYTAGLAGMGLLKSPVLLASVGLVLAALAVYWLPTSESISPGLAKSMLQDKPVAEVPVFMPAPTASAAASVVSGAAVSEGAATAVALPAASASAASPEADGLLQFSASGTTWVEVLDGQAGVLLRKTLQIGETVGVNGTLPMHVTIGRADATLVKVRGSAFDISKMSRDNVARFEVK
jgi:cytoskeleton protein RodZ